MEAALNMREWEASWTDRPGEAIRATVLDPANLSQPDIIAAWDELARHASDPNPYYESWFLTPSLVHFAQDGDVTLLCLERDDAWIGLFPLARCKDYYGKPISHLSAWLHPNMFLGTPLVRRGMEIAFWQALFDWTDAHAGTALFLHLPELSLDTPLANSLGQVAQLQNRRCSIVERYERACLDSDLAGDDYRRAHHSGRKRKGLRRRLSRLSERGEVAFRWDHGDDGLDDWIDDFFRIEASGWKGQSGSALACSPRTSGLFREAVRGAARRGRATRLALTVNDVPVAMLVNFLCPPASFGFKTAYDENFAACSPGVLIENEYLSELDRNAFEWSDSCAAADHPVMNSMWAERRAIGKISVAIGGRIRRAVAAPLIRFETHRFKKGASQ
ncbi:MAG: GNAT family N-acetyltransferase [Erythrobacter sp.]|nr:GNAT family N-acetyltransferase [Erythrobacter sp.]